MHCVSADRAYRCGVCRELYSMPPRMLHGRLHVMGSLKALAMTALIALLALGVSGKCLSARLATLLAVQVDQHRCSAHSELRGRKAGTYAQGLSQASVRPLPYVPT